MAISLSKGQKISLTKGNPGLSSITVGLGWDVNMYDTGTALEATVCVHRTLILCSTAI